MVGLTLQILSYLLIPMDLEKLPYIIGKISRQDFQSYNLYSNLSQVSRNKKYSNLNQVSRVKKPSNIGYPN